MFNLIPLEDIKKLYIELKREKDKINILMNGLEAYAHENYKIIYLDMDDE